MNPLEFNFSGRCVIDSIVDIYVSTPSEPLVLLLTSRWNVAGAFFNPSGIVNLVLQTQISSWHGL